MQLPPQLTTTSQGEQAGLGRPLFVRLSELELPMVMLRTQYRVCVFPGITRCGMARSSRCLAAVWAVCRA